MFIREILFFQTKRIKYANTNKYQSIKRFSCKKFPKGAEHRDICLPFQYGHNKYCGALHLSEIFS